MRLLRVKIPEVAKELQLKKYLQILGPLHCHPHNKSRTFSDNTH